MNDFLQITGLSTKTRIGVYAWEQQILQPILIDLQIPIEVSTCKDSLERTIDYEKLCLGITEYVESNRFTLIETLAESLADLIKKTYSVPSITVSVTKPLAIKNAQKVTVTLKR